MNKNWKVGDDVWIYLLGHQGNRTRGRVIHLLELPGYSCPLYVIEIETGLDPHLEIRYGLLDMYPN